MQNQEFTQELCKLLRQELTHAIIFNQDNLIRVRPKQNNPIMINITTTQEEIKIQTLYKTITLNIQDPNSIKELKDGCSYFDIRLLDHIILTEDGYYSFMDEGIL